MFGDIPKELKNLYTSVDLIILKMSVKLENILFENGNQSLTLLLTYTKATNLYFRNSKGTPIKSESSYISLNDIQFEKCCSSAECFVIDI